MFPPPKKKPAGPGGPPQGGPPDPTGSMAPPPPPQAPPGPPGGGPPPGAGADPMSAMMGQLGPGMMPPPEQQPAFPAGPDGMPFGSSMPGMDGDDGYGDGTPMDVSGSPLLQQLMGSLSQDPYGVMPGEPDQTFDGTGTADPSMGLEQLLQMLALAQGGVGGGPPDMMSGPRTGVAPGGSGVPTGAGNIGGMLGF